MFTEKTILVQLRHDSHDTWRQVSTRSFLHDTAAVRTTAIELLRDGVGQSCQVHGYDLVISTPFTCTSIDDTRFSNCSSPLLVRSAAPIADSSSHESCLQAQRGKPCGKIGKTLESTCNQSRMRRDLRDLAEPRTTYGIENQLLHRLMPWESLQPLPVKLSPLCTTPYFSSPQISSDFILLGAGGLESRVSDLAQAS